MFLEPERGDYGKFLYQSVTIPTLIEADVYIFYIFCPCTKAVVPKEYILLNTSTASAYSVCTKWYTQWMAKSAGNVYRMQYK